TPFAILVGLEALLILYLLVPGLRSRGRTGKPGSAAPGLLLLLLIGAALWLGPPNGLVNFSETLRSVLKIGGAPVSASEAMTEAPPAVQSALVSGLLESFLVALAL